MKKFLLLVSFLGLALLSVSAQDTDDDGQALIKKCSTSEMYLELLNNHPELEHSIRESEQEQAAFRKDFEKNYYQKDGDIRIIPVVFHVIHNYGSENISSEQIHDAIRVMNEDFSAQNSSIMNVNPAFTDIIANTGIQFALAQLDPEGNCTNGIIRTAGVITNEGGENLKELSPIWDRSMYLNIWVCKTIASGAAGYSRYPSSVDNSYGATIDGIVVRSDYVGSIGTSSLNKSHTLTHEAGHYLDLPHLWGSTNDPGMSENCDTDDGVADTPNTIGWTTCAPNPQSCGSLDNIENYMEYSYCSKMYTQGQAARMIAALNSDISERVNLWQPDNLEATGVNAEAHVCEAAFAGNTRIICPGETIHFQDFSYNGVIERTWIFQGGQPAVSQSANPDVTYNTPGLYSVSLAAGDGVNVVTAFENDYIRVLDTAFTPIPFTESFESTPDFNTNSNDVWFTDNIDGEVDWEITDQAAYTGSKSAYVHGRVSDVEETEYLLSQTFDLSSLDSTSSVSISFKYACAKRSVASQDRLKVWISKNCGEDWNLRNDLSGEDLYTISQSVSGEFIPTQQSEWREATVDAVVPQYNTTSFRLRFQFVSRNGNNVYIDDINLQDMATVSVDEPWEAIRNSIQIYPNPARDIVNIEIGNLQLRSDLSISLHDITGREIQKVYSGSISGDRFNIPFNVSGLTAGMYILRFSGASGSFAKKFLVEK